MLDAEGTERVYFNGLREIVNNKLEDKLIIKVSKPKNRNMIKEAKDFLSELPQYAEPWIVFDKDKNLNFDSIIEKVKNACIKVDWLNPCIEMWSFDYYGEFPNYRDSVTCCKEFARIYKKHIGQEYCKSDHLLYKKYLTMVMKAKLF